MNYTDPTKYVTDIYNTVLGRPTVDQEGMNYWKPYAQQAIDGTMTHQDLLGQISDAGQNWTYAPGGTLVNHQTGASVTPTPQTKPPQQMVTDPWGGQVPANKGQSKPFELNYQPSGMTRVSDLDPYLDMGSPGDTAGWTPSEKSNYSPAEQYTRDLYSTLTGRSDPDQEGIDFWTPYAQQVLDGTMPHEQLLYEMGMAAQNWVKNPDGSYTNPQTGKQVAADPSSGKSTPVNESGGYILDLTQGHDPSKTVATYQNAIQHAISMGDTEGAARIQASLDAYMGGQTEAYWNNLGEGLKSGQVSKGEYDAAVSQAIRYTPSVAGTSGTTSGTNSTSGTTSGTGTTGQTGQSDLVDIFQPDKYQGSYSGLPVDYRDQILETLAPKLIDSVNNYESNIDKSTAAANELFQSQARRGMEDELQNILNSLAGRNILNSSVASDTISKGMADISRGAADKGYEASMANAALKAQFPALLGNLMDLGKYTESSDPLDPYKLLAQYDWNMS